MIMSLILLSKICCNDVTTLSYIRKCIASVSLQSHTDCDCITLIIVYITCIIYGFINDSPILVIHTYIYVVVVVVFNPSSNDFREEPQLTQSLCR